MTFETLDKIADAYIPLLGFLSFFSLILNFVVLVKKARERRFELRKLLISRCVTFRFLTFYEAINFRISTTSLWKFCARFSLLLLLVGLVYGLMFLDNRLAIWHKLGGVDYSTHTALSLVLTLFLATGHRKYRGLVAASFVAYLLLMLYQGYHTVADIVSTAAVVGLFGFVFLGVSGKIGKKPHSAH